MKFDIHNIEKLTSEAKLELSADSLSKFLEDLTKERFPKQKGKVNVVFVDEDEMSRLNLENRKVEGSTDVLSFNMPEGSEIFGEVYISIEDVKRSVDGYNSLLKESMRMIVHGILHLLGYQHEDYFYEGKDDPEMIYKVQEEILDALMDNLAHKL